MVESAILLLLVPEMDYEEFVYGCLPILKFEQIGVNAELPTTFFQFVAGEFAVVGLDVPYAEKVIGNSIAFVDV